MVLLSGGLDSAVAATIAKCERFEVYALTFDYGQRHLKELDHARRVAQALRVRDHRILKIPLDEFGGSALTDPALEVPKDRTAEQMGQGLPSTYVPGRNTIFLAIALAYAEVVGAEALFIGAHAVDYSGYPDCRPEYFEAFQQVANLATKRAVEGKPPKIYAPLVSWDKAKIIETGMDLRAPLEHTWSCYEDGEKACGRCDACILRRRAFESLGRKDPVGYADGAVPLAALVPAARLAVAVPRPKLAVAVPRPKTVKRAKPVVRARPRKRPPKKKKGR